MECDRISRRTFPEPPGSYYVALNIPKSYPTEKIGALRRDFARKLHPDAHPGASKERLDQLVAELTKINAACDVLGNPSERTRYDKWVEARELEAAAERKREEMKRARAQRAPASDAANAKGQKFRSTTASDDNSSSTGGSPSSSSSSTGGGAPPASGKSGSPPPAPSSRTPGLSAAEQDRLKEERYRKHINRGLGIAYVGLTSFILFYAGVIDRWNRSPTEPIPAADWIIGFILIPPLCLPLTILLYPIVALVCSIIRASVPLKVDPR
ncbi:MAG: DnaJ domain-containing protein [Solirubrobacterales bacterium]|nr:DnaJ domain-containing protein [Solirubrobacterales bacterium]